MRTKKRTLVTSKVYGFNPWMDQHLTINQIMETTGQKSEAPIIRDLIDEALVARRRKTSGTESAQQPSPTQELTESLHTIQVLLLKLIEQGKRFCGSRVSASNCHRRHWRKLAPVESVSGKPSLSQL